MSDMILEDDPVPGVRRITLNRPQSLNAFLDSMYVVLREKLAAIGRDKTIRVVVITGAGRGFCSGHDTATPDPDSWAPKDLGKPHLAIHVAGMLADTIAAIRRLPQPVIAAVNGPAAGFGYSLALGCDMAIAAASAKFVNAYHNAWTGSEAGLSYLLPRAVGAQRAAELLLTARPVLADEAAAIGLVLRAVPDERLMDEVLAIAAQIMENTPLDSWLTKQNLFLGLSATSFEEVVDYEARAIAMGMSSADAYERRAARAEKRAPNFKSQ